MKSYNPAQEESPDRFFPDGAYENWIPFLDKLIVFLIFAIVITLTVPLCGFLYQ